MSQFGREKICSKRTCIMIIFCMYNVILTAMLTLVLHTAELAQKARKEIADYVNNGKEERARIRVSSMRK